MWHIPGVAWHTKSPGKWGCVPGGKRVHGAFRGGRRFEAVLAENGEGERVAGGAEDCKTEWNVTRVVVTISVTLLPFPDSVIIFKNVCTCTIWGPQLIRDVFCVFHQPSHWVTGTSERTLNKTSRIRLNAPNCTQPTTREVNSILRVIGMKVQWEQGRALARSLFPIVLSWLI